MKVFDRQSRDYRITGTAGLRAQGSELLAGAMLTPLDPPWLAGSALDARFCVVATTLGS